MISKADEIFPIVDEEGNTIGKATRAMCHNGSKLLHPVVHLHILTADGKILLQKRAMNKDIQPGKWDTAVGGHVDYGETPAQAVLRESAEELGINARQARQLCRYVFESAIERELVTTFVLTVDEAAFAPRFAEDEIDEVRFWSREEIQEGIAKDLLTPNFVMEYTQILPRHLRKDD